MGPLNFVKGCKPAIIPNSLKIAHLPKIKSSLTNRVSCSYSLGNRKSKINHILTYIISLLTSFEFTCLVHQVVINAHSFSDSLLLIDYHFCLCTSSICICKQLKSFILVALNPTAFTLNTLQGTFNSAHQIALPFRA